MLASLADTLILSHFQAMALFAFFTSLVFTFLNKKRLSERVKYFLWSFLAFLLVAIALGWLMFPFPR
ncbi:MAG: hypothetical protein ACE5H2_01655 [Terriglobia bacterium]